MDETGLYVTELKDHVIIQQEGEDQIYNEEDVVLNIPTEETVGTEVDLVVEGQVGNKVVLAVRCECIAFIIIMLLF